LLQVKPGILHFEPALKWRENSNLLDDSLLLVKALLWSGLEFTTGWSAQLPGNLFAIRLGRVFLHGLLGSCTHLSWPLAALFLGGVALSDILALFILDGLTLNNIILDLMFMVPMINKF
jgi:hypothetical protein